MKTLVVLFLLFDAVTKLIKNQYVLQASAKMGIGADFLFGIGLTLAILIVIYLIPTTAVLGALLLTGYLGGAIAVQLHAGSPFFESTIFPVVFAALVWGPLYLGDARLRALIPFRRGD